jgi:hypothetical protein
LTVPRNDNPKRNTKVYSESFFNKTSPITFRNYLAFSFTENSSEFFFVDNEFYVKSVTEMDYRHSLGEKVVFEETGMLQYERPYRKPSAFWIEISNQNCIENRIKRKNDRLHH